MLRILLIFFFFINIFFIYCRFATVPDRIKNRFIRQVSTVDGFQGQEREIIIMSCVRSNGIGFLTDRQRLCVALTRAKHSLFLCGNFKTFEVSFKFFFGFLLSTIYLKKRIF